MISEFYISDLYGERDIAIKFNGNHKIIVAENGYGKTTILNAFYSLLSGDLSKLRKIFFSEIGIKFSNGVEVKFRKDELENDLKHLKDHHFYEYMESRLGENFVLDLIDDVRRFPLNRMEYSSFYRLAKDKLDIPSPVLRDFLREVGRHPISKKNINTKTSEKLNKIKDNFNCKTLYLPTYRRVEEDIKAFGVSKDDNSLLFPSINFGMEDVKKSIEIITSEILSSSVEWFSKINGQMLSQLVNGFNVTDEMRQSIADPKAVEIVLERIGENISESHKEQILDLVRSGEISVNHDPLVYFVANLLKVYEQQQSNDNAIQNFTTVSNKYLRDKEIVYNESNVTIDILRKKNSNIVNIETLSSGEKQIISLFSLLYLQKKESLAIFFDEPELSLSIEWQKTLLPDIIASGKCAFLFCTTHSPFIFDNDLEQITTDLSDYTTEK